MDKRDREKRVQLSKFCFSLFFFVCFFLIFFLFALFPFFFFFNFPKKKMPGNISQDMKTVGLIFTRKKIERSGFIGLEDYALKRNLRVIHIDLNMPIEEQGELDLVVHKMTDLVAKIERGDKEAARLYQQFIKRIIAKDILK
ncbi:hypothetical protein EDC96DRAFT_307829 [Choanephora cucurbitarum]|nr:hypothetical protein EDC96DRAFT_307829 [Choanephora cucurbitarum]